MTATPLQFLLMLMAGWVNRRQLEIIDYLKEERMAKAPPASFFSSAVTLETLALSLAGLGRETEALARLDEALAGDERTGGEPPAQGNVLTSRAMVLARLGRIAEARADDERAVRVLERRFGPVHPAVAIALIGMASCDLRLGQPTRAVAPLERAVVLLGVRPSRPWQLAEGQFALARALRATGDRGPRARELAVAARAGYGISGAAHAGPSMSGGRSWISDHSPRARQGLGNQAQCPLTNTRPSKAMPSSSPGLVYFQR